MDSMWILSKIKLKKIHIFKIVILIRFVIEYFMSHIITKCMYMCKKEINDFD